MQKSYKLEGLDCASCADKIEKSVQKIHGVEKARVDFMAEKMTLEVESGHDLEVENEARAVIGKLEPDVKVISLKDVKEEEGEHIFIKSNLKKLKIFTSKIKWIEAFGDYVRVVTEDDSNLVLSTMKSFENDLSKDKFIRVHKSYIINIDKVERFNSKFAEIGITKIPLSRNKKEDLVKALSTPSS